MATLNTAFLDTIGPVWRMSLQMSLRVFEAISLVCIKFLDSLRASMCSICFPASVHTTHTH